MCVCGGDEKIKASDLVVCDIYCLYLQLELKAYMESRVIFLYDVVSL